MLVDTPAARARDGIASCRRGEWHRGLDRLRPLEPLAGRPDVPHLVLSYLGHALARCERKHAEGTALCERALEVEFFRAETWANLGWVRLHARDRRGAHDAVRRGLAIDPLDPGLLELARLLGRRRRPVLPFLRRQHPLNVALGRLRQALRPAAPA